MTRTKFLIIFASLFLAGTASSQSLIEEKKKNPNDLIQIELKRSQWESIIYNYQELKLRDSVQKEHIQRLKLLNAKLFELDSISSLEKTNLRAMLANCEKRDSSLVQINRAIKDQNEILKEELDRKKTPNWLHVGISVIIGILLGILLFR